MKGVGRCRGRDGEKGQKGRERWLQEEMRVRVMERGGIMLGWGDWETT